MPTLQSHTQLVPTLRDCQVAQGSRRYQNLSKCMAATTLDERKSTGIQYCISVMRDEALKSIIFAPNKLCGWWTEIVSENPHYAYTWPVWQMQKRTH